MSEFFRNRRLALALVVAGVGTIGIGGATEALARPNGRQPVATIKYYPDGSRVIDYSDPSYGDVRDFCDGHDLLEQTQEVVHGGSGGSGNSLSRSVNHPACRNDEFLRPSDFPVSLAVQVEIEK